MAKTDFIHLGGPIFCLGVGIATLIMLQRDPRLILSQWFWDRTQGTALSVTLGTGNVSGAGSSTRTVYFPELRYRYSIGSVEYVGDRYGHTGSPPMPKEEVLRWSETVRKNRDVGVEVYYDPKNPQSSYAYINGIPRHGVFGFMWYGVLFGTVWAACWIPIGVWRTIKLKRKTDADEKFAKIAAKEMAKYRWY
jgi:hypothetical protein